LEKSKVPDLLGIPEEKTEEPEILTPEDFTEIKSALTKSKKGLKKNLQKKPKGSPTSVTKKSKKDKKLPYLSSNPPKSSVSFSQIQSNRSIKESLLNFGIPEIETVTGSNIYLDVSSKNTPRGSNASKSPPNIPDKINFTAGSMLPEPAPAMSFVIPSQARSNISGIKLEDHAESNLDPFGNAMFEAKKDSRQMETSVYNPPALPHGNKYLIKPKRRQGANNLSAFGDTSLVKAVTVEKSVDQFPITNEKSVDQFPFTNEEPEVGPVPVIPDDQFDGPSQMGENNFKAYQRFIAELYKDFFNN
jgi:hypothetical protein